MKAAEINEHCPIDNLGRALPGRWLSARQTPKLSTHPVFSLLHPPRVPGGGLATCPQLQDLLVDQMEGLSLAGPGVWRGLGEVMASGRLPCLERLHLLDRDPHTYADGQVRSHVGDVLRGLGPEAINGCPRVTEIVLYDESDPEAEFINSSELRDLAGFLSGLVKSRGRFQVRLGVPEGRGVAVVRGARWVYG